MSEPAEVPGKTGRWAKQRRKLGSVGGWVAGVAAGVISAVIATWLLSSKPSPPPPPDGVPFTLAVRVLHGPVNGQGWIVGGPPARVLARPGWGGDWLGWAARAAAVPHGPVEVDFTVQGRSEAQVTLTGLRVTVVARRPAVAGTLFLQAGGDPGTFRAVVADLDHDPPALRSQFDGDFIPGNVPAAERKPITFPYRVSISDAETFEVLSLAKKCDCEFVLELSWAAEGRVGTVTIDDNGRPFRVSGDANVGTVCTVQPESGPESCGHN